MATKETRQYGSWLPGHVTWRTLLLEIAEKLPKEFDAVDQIEIKLVRKPTTITRKGDPTFNEPFGVAEDVINPAFSAWKAVAELKNV